MSTTIAWHCKRTFVVAALIVVLTVPDTARAQESSGWVDAGFTFTQDMVQMLISYGSIALGLSAVTGAVSTAGHAAWQSDSLARYIRRNRMQLHHDLSLGGGPTVTDLRAILGVPRSEHDEFARVLRDNRRRLHPLVASDEVDSDMAEQFAAIVLEEMHDSATPWTIAVSGSYRQ